MTTNTQTLTENQKIEMAKILYNAFINGTFETTFEMMEGMAQAWKIDIFDFEGEADTFEATFENLQYRGEFEAFEAVAQNYDFSTAVEKFHKEDIRIYEGCYNMAQVVEQLADEGCIDLGYIIKDNERYIDDKQLLHDLYCGGDIQDYYYNYVKECELDAGKEEDEAERIACDYEITYEDECDYLECVIESLTYEGNEALTRYFDYEAYGNDLEIEGDFVEYENGYIEVIY